MRKLVMMAGGCLMLTSCGGSGGSGAGSAPPAATPTSTPTSTPSPSPSPSPTATSTPPTSVAYARFADLAGDRSFQTACASAVLGAGLPAPQPILAFGEALTLGYAAATGGWAVTGDGVSAQFTSADAVSAPAGQRSYERTVAGSAQRLTITDPVVGGGVFDYVRTLTLRAARGSGTSAYACVFGVPAVAADAPTAATAYSRTSISGTAYVLDPGGAVQTYTLAASTATVSFDPGTRALVVRLRLVGNLQTAGGTATTTTDLGTFTGNGAVDLTRTRFGGQLDSGDRVNLFSSFGGWFFGGTETGAAFEILAVDPGTGNRMAVVATVVAAR